QRLINQLLNLAMLEAGKMKLQCREEDLVPLVNMFVQAFESYARQKKIGLVYHTHHEALRVYVDRDKMEKILNNLLSNAFKFTPEGGRIEVILDSGDCPLNDHPCAEIRVSDTGIGIPADKRDRIFDRFFQGHRHLNDQQAGSGIGLALTRELVTLHHGTISAESRPGGGSTFTVRLPLGAYQLKADEIAEDDQPGLAGNVEVSGEMMEFQAEAEAALHHKEPNSRSLVKKQSGDTGEDDSVLHRILIIEDNTDLRFYIRGLLENIYRIIEASDGEEGLGRAVEELPDLVISDVMMPGMDGYQLCEKLKNDEKTCHIPVILLTARASLESKLEGLHTGADDFITKPFEPDELKMRIHNLIAQRNRLRELYRNILEPWTGLIPWRIKENTAKAGVVSVNRRFLEKARGIIHTRLTDSDFSVEELAREIGLSRAQLHRKMKALVDQTPSEFIRSIRLNKAAEMLAGDGGNISEISYQVGFNNPTYFSSSFSKQFNMTPSEFIKQYSGH
ncbi:MAG: response regulator, partial [Bacteroidales bacterium]|nr:response regulator [Bacteroidales bacterium]